MTRFGLVVGTLVAALALGPGLASASMAPGGKHASAPRGRSGTLASGMRASETRIASGLLGLLFGNSQWTRRNLPYGEQVDGDTEAPITFTGLRNEDVGEKKPGMLSAMYRDYRPHLGRWTRPDPAGDIDGANPYRYVGNSPLGRTDPSGLTWTWPSVFGALMSTPYGVLALTETQGVIPSTAHINALRSRGRVDENVSTRRPGNSATGDPDPGLLILRIGRPVFGDTNRRSEQAANTYVHEAHHVLQLLLTFRRARASSSDFFVSQATRVNWEVEGRTVGAQHFARRFGGNLPAMDLADKEYADYWRMLQRNPAELQSKTQTDYSHYTDSDRVPFDCLVDDLEVVGAGY